jgi:hypothetical protein
MINFAFSPRRRPSMAGKPKIKIRKLARAETAAGLCSTNS